MIYGVGIDVVDNDRMLKALRRQPKIISKILTSREQKDLEIPHRDEMMDKSLVQSIAARFAAKEALVKSLHLSLFSVGLHSIEILRDPKTQAPLITVDFSHLSNHNELDIPEKMSFLCSISHSEVSSVAVVIAQS